MVQLGFCKLTDGYYGTYLRSYCFPKQTRRNARWRFRDPVRGNEKNIVVGNDSDLTRKSGLLVRKRAEYVPPEFGRTRRTESRGTVVNRANYRGAFDKLRNEIDLISTVFFTPSFF